MSRPPAEGECGFLSKRKLIGDSACVLNFAIEAFTRSRI